MLKKYFTRKFTLLEHSIVIESFLKAVKGTPFRFDRIADVFTGNMVTMYMDEGHVPRGKEYAQALATQNPHLAEETIRDIGRWGEEADELEQEERSHPPQDDEQCAHLIKKAFSIMERYALYVELTHHLGNAGVPFSEDIILRLGRIHDQRRLTLEKILEVIGNVGRNAAQRHGIRQGHTDQLTYNEFLSFLDGTLKKEEAERLIDRRSERCLYIVTGDREEVFGKDDFDRRWEEITESIIFDEESAAIKGLGISKGLVRGKVQVITPETPLRLIAKGSVIVTTMTLPWMTPALKDATAIVTDEGSMLCHAACVAREFGVPCVVGTKNATNVLKDGDIVEVDAEKGVVRRV